MLGRVRGHVRQEHAADAAEQEVEVEGQREQHRDGEPDLRLPERPHADQVDETGRNRDEFRGQHEQRPHVRVDAAVEQVVLPDEEGQDAHAEHPGRGDLVAEQRLAAEHRDHLGDDAEARQRQDVHLGMAEEPEQVLVQEAAAAELVGEERGLEGPVGEPHVARPDQHRHRQHLQERHREHRPDEHGEPAPAHAGRPVVDNGDDHVEAGQDHRDAHQAEREEVGVLPLRGLGGQRLVTGPAGGEPAHQHGGQQDDVRGRSEPEAERLEPRERDPLRPDQQRAEVLAERPEDDRRHHHHHHRAVLADHHQVLLRAREGGRTATAAHS